jgi:hypothetical protein
MTDSETIDDLRRSVAHLQSRITPTRKQLKDVRQKANAMGYSKLLQAFRILCDGQESFLDSYNEVLGWNAILLDLIPKELHGELRRRLEDSQS